MCSGLPTRPNACIASEALSAASFEVIFPVKGVSTKPGATQFTRILRTVYVAAAESVSPMTPAFAAAMAS